VTRRHRRDEDGLWSEQESLEPGPTVDVRDIDEDRWVPEQEWVRDEEPTSRLHPVWASLAMSLGINLGLIAALAAVAWWWP